MAGFGWMYEEGRGTGAGQGGGDLVADMSGLAHADHHHAALAGQEDFASPHEVTIDTVEQIVNGLEFEADGALRGLNQFVGLAHKLAEACMETKAADYSGKAGWGRQRMLWVSSMVASWILGAKCRGGIVRSHFRPACRRRCPFSMGLRLTGMLYTRSPDERRKPLRC